MRIPSAVAWLLISSSGLLAESVSTTPAGGRASTAPRPRPQPRAWREYTYDKSAWFAELDGTGLWIGSAFGGVYRWNTLTGEARNFTRVGDGLLDNTALDLAVRDGEVWVGHWWGLSHYDGAEWETYDASNSPIHGAMAVAALDGVLWVGTWDQGLFRYDGTTWTQFSVSNSGLSDDLVTSIEVDASGDLWIGAWGDGVDRFDGASWSNYSPADSGLISYFVWVRATHPTDGRVWAYCHDDSFNPQVGVAEFGGVSSWQMILPPGSGGSSADGPVASSGIHSEYIHSVVVDSAGAVWYEGSGAISRQQGTSWTLFGSIPTSLPCSLPHGGALAAGPGGVLWAATDAGLLRYDGFDFESHATSGLWDMDVPEVSVDQNGTAWMATRAGVHGVKDGLWTRYTTQNSPLFQDRIDTVAATPDGGLLVGGSQGGAAHVRDGQWTTWNTSNSGIHSDHVLAAGSSSSGAYWFGSGI
jgi:ligand-binding sensor domain-containing protein